MRFRFTIRDLLWLTLAVALALGWWVDHKPQRYQLLGAFHDEERSRYWLLIDNKTGESFTVEK